MEKPKIQDKPKYCNAWATRDSDIAHCNSIPCCGFCFGPKLEQAIKDEKSFPNYDKIGLHPN